MKNKEFDEFIKKLKEEIRGFPYINQCMKIDKLAKEFKEKTKKHLKFREIN